MNLRGEEVKEIILHLETFRFRNREGRSLALQNFCITQLIHAETNRTKRIKNKTRFRIRSGLF